MNRKNIFGKKIFLMLITIFLTNSLSAKTELECLSLNEKFQESYNKSVLFLEVGNKDLAMVNLNEAQINLINYMGTNCIDVLFPEKWRKNIKNENSKLLESITNMIKLDKENKRKHNEPSK